MKEIQQLQSIGLTEGEIRIYDALLRIGEATKTKLAKEAGISPSNIYDITNRLKKKGIISSVERNKVLHFSPSNPRNLLDYLQQKKAEIAEEEQVVQNLLPTLLASFTEQRERTQVEVYTGWEGLRTVFLDQIEECQKGDTVYVYGASKGVNEKQADIFFLKYSRIRERKGIRIRIIFNEDVRERTERIEFFLKSKNCSVKFLNQTTNTEVFVYKDTTTILILSKDPIVIRIRGKDVAESFIQHFSLLWKLARE